MCNNVNLFKVCPRIENNNFTIDDGIFTSEFVVQLKGIYFEPSYLVYFLKPHFVPPDTPCLGKKNRFVFNNIVVKTFYDFNPAKCYEMAMDFLNTPEIDVLRQEHIYAQNYNQNRTYDLV